MVLGESKIRALCNVSINKSDLVSIFESNLLSRKYGYDTSSSISKELIKDIVIHRGFLVSFTNEIRNKKMKYTNILDAIDFLVDAIFTYFSNTPLLNCNDFDKWEKETGEKFLEKCREYKEFQFGKAQKIINVTMKHLYCYNVSEEYFKFCHVALDSMTYTGRKTNALDGGFYKNEVNNVARTKSFSNLTYEEYIIVQNEIREYLLNSVHEYVDSTTLEKLSPFKAEFYIWPRYKK